MQVFRKGTLLIPTGPVKHLHVVMNDPVYSPEHRDERVLVVNISSIKDDCTYDDSCVLKPGCHPFVKQPSYVYYRDAAALVVPRIIEKVELGEFDLHHPVDQDLYLRVLNGFNTSKHVKPKIKRFLKQHVISS